MGEKFVKATYVRLVAPSKSIEGKLTQDWSENNAKDLVVFPDTGIARARFGTFTRIARFASADVDQDSQEYWERGGFQCPHCSQLFENAQGLGGHVSQKHQGKAKP